MSEIRALLLTDVVDSTQLSEELGDAVMAELWTQHDRVARDLLPLWRGREIDKTDGMLLLFAGVEDAVRYAQAYHQAIGALSIPLTARAGLHLGAVILRENSAEDVSRGAKPLEVEGLAKPTAARIMSIAAGGQTLLSAEAVAELNADDLATESHGHWMMKGVSDALEIFEVGPKQTVFKAPLDGEKVYRVTRVGERWLPVREIPNNLPQQGSRFIGREQELRDIKELLGSARLVTLLGMGGLGKTRLSLQAAAELMHRFPDGVWFLDLAPISDPALALSEAAQVLGVREEPERSLLQSVCAYLKTRRVLMIFDNCEHLIKPAAELAQAVVKAAPFVRLAASSREALRIPGEHAYPILPLPLPKPGDKLETLLQSTAVRLFVDRARAHKPSFELTEDDAPAVIELVSRLEGIPLALELAAARVRALSVSEINRRLSDRYKFLTGGSRVLQERQQTLRALVDWSYEMLQESEKTLLNRLAPFKGGFDMDAAEAVCGAEPLSADEILDLLTSLIEKSLVQQIEHPGSTRYKMLETIRDYAREKLSESHEFNDLRVAHCHYYFDLAKRARDGLRGPQQGAWLTCFEDEQDNLRAAMALAQSDDGTVDPILTVKLAVAQQNFWVLRGHAAEGRAAVAAMLGLDAVRGSPMVHAHALYVAAVLAWSQSDHAAALDALSTCLALRRDLANPALLAPTLSTIALAKLSAGDGDGAREAARESLQLFQQCEDPGNQAIVLLQLGQIDIFQGLGKLAGEQHLHDALALARKIRHPETEAEVELALGQIAFDADEPAQATLAFARSLKICLAAGDRRGAANALWWQSKLDLQSALFEQARVHLGDALSAFHAFGMREQLLGCLEDHAALALLLSDHELSVGLAAATGQLRDNAKLCRSAGAERRWQALLSQIREAMETEAFELHWQSALNWSSDELLNKALGLTVRVAASLH
ncbi:NB-ARC domain-containing protein [Paucibacter sp. AS339]|uniref:NB-ARC domain-containing protein n=1 Tax=Paucibacter hankyongi TaxID=3133434 RepID=UPI00309A9E14